MSKAPAVGIDLGTTSSAIAYINQHGKPEIIPNREGDRATPSVVLLDGDAPVVGTLANRSAVASPLNICQFVKRQMGERDWCFVAEDDKEYTAEAISALILRRLIEDAQMQLNCTIREAVLTVPAYFNDAQRKATQDAGRIAGLENVRLINEPTAAALKPSFEVHPDEVVATGAAVRASIARRDVSEPTPSNLDGLPPTTIVDVNSHSLGVVALADDGNRTYNSIVLAKDTAYGTRKSRIYGTVIDNQRTIQLAITEGEEETVDYVRTIGKGTIDIPLYPKGAPVEVVFEYNDDGMIVVTVYDKTAGREIGKLRIQRESNRSLKEIEGMKREISTIKVH